MTLQPDELRRVMRSWSSGIALITSHHEGDLHGMTATSFTAVSLEPPLALVCLDRDSRTLEMINLSHVFAAVILSQDQRELSDLFAGRLGREQDKFANIPYEQTPSGNPVPLGSLAYIDCRVAASYDGGGSLIVVGEVLDGRVLQQGKPLVYFNRGYQSLAD